MTHTHKSSSQSTSRNSSHAESVRFIHSSDWQLGMYRHFLAEGGGNKAEAQARFSAARLRAVAALGELAEEVDAEFIVVAGDVFDYNSLTRQTEGRIWEVLKALPVPVYLLPGNHDPLVAHSIFHKTKELDGVYYFADIEPLEVRPGVELIGAPLRARTATHDLVADAIAGLEPDPTIRIVVGHGQVQGRSSEPKPDLINLHNVEEKLRVGAIDYLALGDTHNTEELGTTGAVWFSGSPEVTDFHDLDSAGGGEHDSGNALVVDIAKAGPGQAQVRVDKRQVGTWTFDTFKEILNSPADVDRFVQRLEAYPRKDSTVVKYALEGAIGMEDNRRLEEELERLRPVFANIYPRERLMDLIIAPSEDELANADISGFAQAALDELVADMDHDPAARDAANLLYRLARKEG